MNTKIKFSGSFGEYFIMSLGLLLLSAITFGLATPYWMYWSYKYFFTRMQVGDQKVKFTGGFGEYFIMSLGLMLLSVITFGIALPYWLYWSVKYFFTRLEVVDGYSASTRIEQKQNDTKQIAASPETDDLFD